MGAADAAGASMGGAKTLKKDSLEELKIDLQKDVDQMVKLIVPKLKEAEAKDASSKFLTDVTNSLMGKLSLGNSESLLKTVNEFCAKRKKAEAAASAVQKKA